MNKSSAGPLNKSSVSDVMKKYGLLLVIIVMMMVMSIVRKEFLTSDNLINVLRQVSINGIIAAGMTFVILLGGIDLSVGSLVAVGGVVCASIVNLDNSSMFIAIVAGMLVAGIFGLFNGALVAFFDMPAFVATLASMTIARGFALVYSNGRPYILKSEAFKVLGQGYVGPIPVPVILLILVIAIMYFLLNHTRYGRYVYAIGGNEKAAIMSGVKIRGVKITVFTISGLLSGLAGVILASRINSGQPAIGTAYEMDAITAVVIGGTSLSGGIGTIVGTVMGFIIIGILNNALTLLNVSSYYQQIVKGLIIVIAVLMDIRSKRGSR